MQCLYLELCFVVILVSGYGTGKPQVLVSDFILNKTTST